MPFVRTVLGDIPPDRLGTTFVHEHLIINWPGSTYDPAALDVFDRGAMLDEVTRKVRDIQERHGVGTFVDEGPPDLGRDVEFEAEVSQRTGLHVVAATGFYKATIGLNQYWRLMEEDVYEEYMEREITQGVPGTSIRCGVIKLGTNGEQIVDEEQKAFRAAARVSKRTGCPINTHTDPEGWRLTNVGLNQLDILLGEGADPSRIIIGHACGSPRLDYLVEVLKRGCYVAFDRVGSVRLIPNEIRAGLCAALVAMGYGDKILLSHDAHGGWIERPPRAPWPWTGKHWGMIHEIFLPMLRKGGVSERAVEQMLVENPQRALAF